MAYFNGKPHETKYNGMIIVRSQRGVGGGDPAYASRISKSRNNASRKIAVTILRFMYGKKSKSSLIIGF